MNRLIKLGMAAVLVMAGVLSLRVWAGDKHDMACVTADGKPLPAEFAKLKSLVGTWTGKSKMHGDKEQKIKVTYALTAGGTAIVEKLFPGTPSEMTSVYHLEEGKLCMTHYCMLGNCPKMRLKGSTENSLSFEMRGRDGISSSKEMHMHALTITWKDKNHISEDWISYQEGKAAPSSPFNLSRKK